MSFNLVIDSLNGSGDDGDLTYSIDWSFLADGQDYDMTFSYRSTAPYSSVERSNPNTNNGGELYMSMPDLPMNSYEVVGPSSKNYGRAKSSNVIGVLTPVVYNPGNLLEDAGDYFIFQTGHTYNPPVRVSKPMNNVFRVQLYAKGVDSGGLDNPTERPLMDGSAQDYMLILNFKKCSCNE
jgi:hypothetical protein